MQEHPTTVSPMVAIDVDELRRKRQLKGLNQAALSRLAGVHPSHISRIEKHEGTRVSPAVFARICDALDVEDRTELMAS